VGGAAAIVYRCAGRHSADTESNPWLPARSYQLNVRVSDIIPLRTQERIMAPRHLLREHIDALIVKWRESISGAVYPTVPHSRQPSTIKAGYLDSPDSRALYRGGRCPAVLQYQYHMSSEVFAESDYRLIFSPTFMSFA